MRINTDILLAMIKSKAQFNGVVYCERFVGKGSGQMTDEEQDAILKRFRSNLPGLYSLLILLKYCSVSFFRSIVIWYGCYQYLRVTQILLAMIMISFCCCVYIFA
jgi:hypothetical protein